MVKRYNVGKWCFVASLLLIIPTIILAFYDKRMVSDTIFMVILTLMAGGSLFCTYKNDKATQSVAYQMALCSILGFLFWSLNLFYRFFHVSGEISFCGVFGWLMLLCSMYLWIYYYIKSIKVKSFSRNMIKEWLRKNADWISIAFLFILLNMDIYNLWIKSDGYIYYKGFLSNLGQWDFSFCSMDKLRMAGHLTAGYSFLWTLGAVLWGKVGLKVINMIMAVVTIFCFKKILHYIAPKLNKICVILLQVIFAFAPLFFGISYEISADYPIFCFFVWFVYCWCYQKRILAFFMACMLCFTKESSPFFLFGFLVGEFIYYMMCIWKGRKEGVLNQIKSYFMNSYLYTAYAGIIYVISFLCSNTGWVQLGKKSITGEKTSTVSETVQQVSGGRPTGFSFDIDYIVTKLNEMFLMNFSWVILLFLFIVSCFLIYQKGKQKTNKCMIKKVTISLLPLWTAWGSFLLFNLLFITYVNYRYIQLHWFFYILLLSYLISKMQCNWKRVNIGLTIIAILLLAECYMTLDPVTYMSFDKINVGNIKVVTTKKYIGYDNILYTKEERDDVRGEMLFDSLTYNRQCIALEKLTEKAFESLHYNSDMQVILPPILNGKTEYTFRGYFGRPEFDTYYWNEETYNITDKDSDTKINFVDYYFFIKNAKTGDTAYYLQYPYVVGFDEKSALKNNFTIEETIPFEQDGWTMNLLKVRKK